MSALLRSRAFLVGVVVGLPLSAFFFWLAFRNADVAEVWSVLTDANLAFVALAVCAMAAVYVGQAVRWQAIARTPSVSTAKFAEMVVSGVAVNNVLPGRVGDLLRARWLQVAARILAGRALATVFVDRSFDVLALVVFLAISLPFVAGAEWLQRIAVGGLALLTVLGLVLLAARVYTRTRARDRRSRRGLVRRVARDTIEGLADPIGRMRALALAGTSLATWAIWALAAWLVARAVGIELSPLEAIFVTGVINLGVAIPSSPGFIGTYQWLGVAALGLLDIGTDQALAFAILMHAVWYVPTMLVGGALLLRRSVRAVGRPSVVGVARGDPPKL
jgi:glycosyltransferase 2 family protein